MLSKECCNEIHRVIIPHMLDPIVNKMYTRSVCLCFRDGPPWSMLVSLECSFLLEQRWKLMVIKQQLQAS